MFNSVKSALVTVLFAYCIITAIIAMITSCLYETSISTALGIMSCVAAVGGILIIRFFKDEALKDETQKINTVETQKFFNNNTKDY